MIQESNLIVNGLWIGKQLSNLELLTLNSFVKHGHKFNLWVYDEIETPLPAGVIVKDANEIIPHTSVFKYKYDDPVLNHGKGSYAGFSDLFRYKLLYERGGWWVDMDVTCLKPLVIDEPYFFKYNYFVTSTGNLMKCPKGSPLMNDCYNTGRLTINETNRNWLEPIQILNEGIKKYGLEKFIKRNFANDDIAELVFSMLFFPGKPSNNWHAIHWMNEVWRNKNIAKNQTVKNSCYQYLLKKYSLPYTLVEPAVRIWQKYEWIGNGVLYPEIKIVKRIYYKLVGKVLKFFNNLDATQKS